MFILNMFADIHRCPNTWLLEISQRRVTLLLIYVRGTHHFQNSD